ncbi:MAG TPA: tripartite tricarboxylate transporter substrate binding protein [Xanthobacteraceae bacterium]|nr:tripartite tricarboxylate transporter substrate binding protein [Xanthobacteraceae bacterium]
MKRSAITTMLAAVLALAAAGGAADAQNFPARPVTLIVPWPAGGTTDVGMRALANATEKHLGQSIVIENRPGGSGTLGPGQMAATAKPDGYTVAQIPITVFRFPFMQKTTFDPAADFTYIISVSGYTFGVVVKDDAPWKTFPELVAAAKAEPGKINYGSPGTGTSLHIAMEQIAKQQGVKWTHVPFKGNAEAMNALLGGHIHAVADSSGWAQLVNSGRFRLLVTWGAARTKNWPNVPTLREVGIDLVSNSPFGIAGPKGMDPKVVKTLHDAFKKGLEDPSYVEAMAKLDQEQFYLSSEDYQKFALQQIEEARRFIAELGLGPKQD